MVMAVVAMVVMMTYLDDYLCVCWGVEREEDEESCEDEERSFQANVHDMAPIFELMSE